MILTSVSLFRKQYISCITIQSAVQKSIVKADEIIDQRRNHSVVTWHCPNYFPSSHKQSAGINYTHIQKEQEWKHHNELYTAKMPGFCLLLFFQICVYMWMWVCVCIRGYVWVYVWKVACLSVYVWVCVWERGLKDCVYEYVLWQYMSVCVYVKEYMWECICVWKSMCVSKCLCESSKVNNDLFVILTAFLISY